MTEIQQLRQQFWWNNLQSLLSDFQKKTNWLEPPPKIGRYVANYWYNDLGRLTQALLWSFPSCCSTCKTVVSGLLIRNSFAFNGSESSQYCGLDMEKHFVLWHLWTFESPSHQRVQSWYLDSYTIIILSPETQALGLQSPDSGIKLPIFRPWHWTLALYLLVGLGCT